jgi:hypothetical protein
MVGDANLRLSTSGAPWTFRLCAAPWTLVAGYADSGDLETDLTRLSNPADGFLDAVPADRSMYRPDLVCLITNSGTGLGYAPAITAELTVSSGYSVVALDLSITNGTFAHEVGHNMGGKHNAEQPDGVSGINGTAQGIARYCDVPDGICGSCEDREFRTTMSYAVSTSVPSQRIQRYSVNGLQATLNGSLGSCTVDLWSATAQAILTFEVSRPLVSNYNVASSQLWVQPGVNGVGTFLSPRRSVREALAVVQGGFAEGVLKVRAGTLDETGLVGGPAQLSGAGRIEAVGGVVTIE